MDWVMNVMNYASININSTKILSINIILGTMPECFSLYMIYMY